MAEIILKSSGSISRQLRLVVTETSTSIADNTSTVTWTLYSENGSDYVGMAAITVYVNGQLVYSESAHGYDWHYFPVKTGEKSGTITVAHDSDGTKKNMGFSITGDIYYSSSHTVVGYMDLSTIARAASVDSASNINTGSAVSVAWTPKSTALYYTVAIHNGTSYVASENVTVSSTAQQTYAGYVPTNADIPNATNATYTATVITYLDADRTSIIGSSSKTFTVSVPADVKPVIRGFALYPVNTNGWFESKGIYVAGYSAINAVADASAGDGSSLAAIEMSGAFTASGWNVTSPVLYGTGDKTVTVTVTDTRGRTNTASATATFLAYAAPSLYVSCQRGTLNGTSWTASDTGEHIAIGYTAEYSLADYGNTAYSVSCAIGSYSPVYTYGNYFYFNQTNSLTTYTATVTLMDSAWGTTTGSATIPTVAVPFNLNVDKPAVAFGKIAEEAKTVEIASDWTLDVHGDITAKHNFGAYDVLIVTGSYQAFTAPTDGYFIIYCTDTTGTGSLCIDANGTALMRMVNAGIYSVQSVFLRKGTVVYYNGTSGIGMQFYRLS